jgi:glycosyltransferase involved in cell wall biosynthesis
MLASVVIPCKGRVELLNRLLRSILKSENSDLVEIIVVDDNSDIPIHSDVLRDHDKIIRLKKSCGAAVARNIGIENSLGKVIFLFDSDDYIIEHDFKVSSEFALKNNSLCYCSIISKNYKSKFPDVVEKSNFFQEIFKEHPFICQTSSLYFPKALNLKFDETLPKHQDWDFIYYSCLMSEVDVIRGAGIIYFDRDDKNSLSRKHDFNVSLPWLKKLKNDITTEEFEFVNYNILARFPTVYKFDVFFLNSIRLLLKKKVTLYTVCKYIYFRFKLN